MSKYKVVIVGMGKRGKHHASAFHANEAFDVVGICDINEETLADAAETLDNPKTYTDALTMLTELKPDVFCFCTMPHLRENFIKMGINAGVKLIAFEKPVADSSENAVKVKTLLDGSGVKAVVSHQHRYGAHYSKVKEIVASGAIGNVHTIYASSTGWMAHMMTHLIDYMRWYNDNVDAEWVMGQASGRGKLTDNHPSPDYIGGFIQFANGVRGIVEAGAGAPDIPEVAKWWGRCRIRVQGNAGFAEVLTNGGWRAVTKDGLISGEGAMNYAADMPPYIQEMADWLDDDSKVHPCNFESAYAGYEIMMGICQSAVKGGQIALPLETYGNEIADLTVKLANSKVIFAAEDHKAEYPESV